jgi:hypothetical protein
MVELEALKIELDASLPRRGESSLVRSQHRQSPGHGTDRCSRMHLERDRTTLRHASRAETAAEVPERGVGRASQPRLS